MAGLAAEFPKIVERVDALVSKIADCVAGAPPDQLLISAWRDFYLAMSGRVGEATPAWDKDEAMRMIEYIQSLVASVPASSLPAEPIGEQQWLSLRADVVELFRVLTIDYQISHTAHRRATNPSIDMELEEFRVRAEMFWLNVRGKRYHSHEKQALLELLAPHSEVLLRLFGIDAEMLAAELEKVLAKLTYGQSEAYDELQRFHADVFAAMEGAAPGAIEDLPAPGSPLDALARVLRDPAFAARGRKVLGEAFGLDLFDLQKTTILPPALIDRLAWSPGEDDEFFAPGPHRGWPLRVWPTAKRPFIRLNGRIYCFHLLTLFDNFYRVLRRLVVSLEPDYKEEWNRRQKSATESLPFLYLGKVMPGAMVVSPAFYRWSVAGAPARYYEADGVMAFEDHLFVVEVKAGAFTYTSPATDIDSHIKSLGRLITDPANQGTRFVDYLLSADEAAVLDANHVEVVRLRKGDYRHITVCAVTLDSFTELAARADKLRSVGVDSGARAVWSVSIDDLRIYAEIFDNPLVFLNFIEQRVRAIGAPLVDLDDEFDHLGMYFLHNNYSMYVRSLASSAKGEIRVVFPDAHSAIDKFYAAKFRGDAVALPRQAIPKRIAEIVEFLARGQMPGRAVAVSYLLGLDMRLRRELDDAIDQQLRSSSELRRARPYSTTGDVRLTVFVWSPGVPRDADAAFEHAKAFLAAQGEDDRFLLELTYADSGLVEDVASRRVTLLGLKDEEIQRLRSSGSDLLERRFLAADRAGQLGRNDPCPCGSGKKYKRCHLL